MPPLIPVEEALEQVLARAWPLPEVNLPLSECLGAVLATDVRADVDSPPHSKSIWDGYAVRSADIFAGLTDFEVLEQVTAGELPSRQVIAGTATRVMTGAPIPNGADSIVMVEQSEPGSVPNKTRLVPGPKFTAGQGIMQQGAAMRAGELALRAGTVLRPSDVGLLAESGCQAIVARSQPCVAIITTGNELVAATEVPGPGQIRNSNGPMLAACVQAAGGVCLDLGIARDDEASLSIAIKKGLDDAEILVLSGGVSAGVLDLVPKVLADVGVETVFHKLNLKPGKPLWFGVRNEGDRRNLVFGLPGNPVSSLVCFELFVRPAMRKMRGMRNVTRALIPAQLERDHEQRGTRTTYFPAVLTDQGTARSVVPLPWQGSADLRTLVDANALIRFSGEARVFRRGEQVSVLPLWSESK